MLDTSASVISFEDSVEAGAAMTSPSPGAQKTADSMSPSEREEVETCVRQFVNLQNNNSGATATVKAASDDATDVTPTAATKPGTPAEYDTQSIAIAKKVNQTFERFSCRLSLRLLMLMYGVSCKSWSEQQTSHEGEAVWI